MPAAELFDDDAMAEGYAHDRPPVHPHLMARLRDGPGRPAPTRTALDVGCGAGASTVALGAFATRVIGIDPSAPMVAAARRSVTTASFAAAAAEALPVAAGSIGLIGAAGSLNYAALGPFLAEADRVLADRGSIAVSDHGLGTPDLAPEWPEAFAARWPRPASAPVTASSFGSGPFRVVVDDRFAVTLSMTLGAYLAYVMTETSVVQAVGRGTPVADVRAWCRAALPPEFTGGLPVTFACSLLVLAR
jgi:SAM-dependent methyltransferase